MYDVCLNIIISQRYLNISSLLGLCETRLTSFACFLKMRYLPDLLKLQKISVATCPENEGLLKVRIGTWSRKNSEIKDLKMSA